MREPLPPGLPTPQSRPTSRSRLSFWTTAWSAESTSSTLQSCECSSSAAEGQGSDQGMGGRKGGAPRGTAERTGQGRAGSGEVDRAGEAGGREVVGFGREGGKTGRRRPTSQHQFLVLV
eukprot:358439-Chlamydomonas_euryale.AAC.9